MYTELTKVVFEVLPILGEVASVAVNSEVPVMVEIRDNHIQRVTSHVQHLTGVEQASRQKAERQVCLGKNLQLI